MRALCGCGSICASPCGSLLSKNIHTYIHTYTCTYMHTYIHSYMQAKDDLVLEDGDVDPLMLQDEDAEGQAELDFDDLEAALAAELQLEDIEEQQDVLDDHHEAGEHGGKRDENEDHSRPPASQQLSDYNFNWGAFRFTLKRHTTNADQYSWQCACPFHRRSDKTGCRKTHVVRVGTGRSWAAESEITLDMLRQWANQALTFDRQRKHLAYNIFEGDVPPTDLIMAQMIANPPPRRPESDRQLDALDDGSSSSSSSSN